MSRRKSRLQEQLKTQETKVYKDTFQQEVERRLSKIFERLTTKKHILLYSIIALVVVFILAGAYYMRSKRIDAAAQIALAKAIETAEAPISETPLPAGSDQKVFKNERERAEAAIAEFQKIVDNYGSPYREKAQYFIAVNKLYVDRQSGISELENLAKRNDDVGILSKFALAQAKTAEGRYDEALTIYQSLLNLPDPIISKETLNFNVAQIYEKQGKRPEAAEIYYNIVKSANDSKDSDNKPFAQTQVVREARERLQALDPDRAKEFKSDFSAF
jgi:tetratricopeptide (TPR) repeat protein